MTDNSKTESQEPKERKEKEGQELKARKEREDQELKAKKEREDLRERKSKESLIQTGGRRLRSLLRQRSLQCLRN